MRKRLSSLSILLTVTLLLTALVPFAQAPAETIQQPQAEESAIPETVDEPAVKNTSETALSDENENINEAADSNGEPDGTACPENSSTCSAVPAGDENDDRDVSDSAETDKQSSESLKEVEAEKNQPKNVQMRSSAVSWHMNFNVDCVSSGCIALSDRSAGMYVSACNDGGGEYQSVNFEPVNHTGKFVSYYVSSGDTPTLGNSSVAAIQNPSSSFSYGPMAVHTCVTAVFESEFDTPPADHNEYKRFEFRLTANNGTEVQSTTAYADKYGCYSPSGNTGISASVKSNASCVDPNASAASYEIKISNTGTSDICRTTVSADRPGSFHLKNSSAISSPFVYSQTIYTDDYITVLFDEDLSNAGLSAGGTHWVNFMVSSESCDTAGGSAQSNVSGQIEGCAASPTPTAMPSLTPTRTPVPTGTPTKTPVPTSTSTPAPTMTSTAVPDPELNLDIHVPSDCSYPGKDVPDFFTVTISNTGNTDFCKVEVTGPDGSSVLNDVIDDFVLENNTAVYGLLKTGESAVIVFAVNPPNAEENQYIVNFTAKGFTENNGECAETIQSDASAVMDICEPEPESSLDLDLTAPADCSDPQSNDPEEFPLTVTNSGATDFCRIAVVGPAGSFFSYNGRTTESNTLIIDGLQAGQSALVSGFYKGIPGDGMYRVRFTAEGYVIGGNVCSDNPSAAVSAETNVPVCVNEPEIKADISGPAECHIYSGEDGPDRFDYSIENPGSIPYCTVHIRFDVIVDGKIVKTETVELDPAAVPAGGRYSGTYEVTPEDIPEIRPGSTYSVRITASASVYDVNHGCPQEPSVSDSDNAEKPVCSDVKPVIAVSNLNPECIDAGDTLKFKGMIDVDGHSAAKKITVRAGKISWGGTAYDCEIVSVKKTANTEFTPLSQDERSTSFDFEGFGHGKGVIGFVCEAKTAGNDQKRNGQGLSFNAFADVFSAGPAASYTIESNTVTGSQQCVYTHTMLLPYTGDDTNMPVLVGLFSLFLICGGGSMVILLRRKKTSCERIDTDE